MGKDKLIIDGEEYYKKDFLGSLEGVFLDDFHIVLHRKEVEIKGKKCFMCGEELEISKLEKHHAIPKKLKSVFNVHIPFCKKCHTKFNQFIKEGGLK